MHDTEFDSGEDVGVRDAVWSPVFEAKIVQIYESAKKANVFLTICELSWCV